MSEDTRPRPDCTGDARIVVRFSQRVNGLYSFRTYETDQLVGPTLDAFPKILLRRLEVEESVQSHGVVGLLPFSQGLVDTDQIEISQKVGPKLLLPLKL